MRNELVLYANGKEYPIVDGAIYTEEFSETLDSMSIILDNITQDNRLQLEPYMFVRVKNKQTENALSFDKEFLVDDYIESEENIAQHIYKYTISLMSETKLLEKIQCPNLSISHSVEKGKKSIYTHIKQYYDLYMPRVKMLQSGTKKWVYAPILSLSEDLKTKFDDIPCADLAMQQPTFRQLLTNLMLQEGCIPTVKDRVISYMDLTATSTSFKETANGINKKQTSNSSDSFVNALCSYNDQLLDIGNSVLSETIGFRDRDNAILKQKDNLKLQTQFPIYSIKKAIIRVPCSISNHFYVANTNYKAKSNEVPYFEVTKDSNEYIKFYLENLTPTEADYSIEECYIVFYSGAYVPEKVAIATSSIAWGSFNKVSIPSTYTTSDKFYMYMRFKNTKNYKECEVITRICGLSTTDVTNIANDYFFTDGTNELYGYLKTDFTANIVENSKRRLLDTNYTTMPKANETTSKELAKWVYGTVSYTIGGTEITGFTQTYSQAQGWWDIDKTYFENILGVLAPTGNFKHYEVSEHFDEAVETAYRKYLGGYIGHLELYPEAVTYNYAFTVFDIDYQPLNTMTLKAYKDEVALPLEQLDGTASGLTDFDRFAKNLQQKANRLGVPVSSVNQTTDDQTALQSLNSKTTGDEVVFSRTIAIHNNYLQVTYNLSKDYVIKNYFTSITTKYRAYEHIDYNDSVVRKEHKNVFVVLDTENHANEEDRLVYQDINDFFKGLTEQNSANPSKLRYAVEKDTSGVMVKFDLSVVTSDTAICFTYATQDNATAGTYIDTDRIATDTDLGGVTQTYQLWGDDYAEKRLVGYFNDLGYYSSTTMDMFFNVCKSPKAVATDFSKALVNVFDYDSEYLYQYKDEGERLCTTLQLTYINKIKNFAYTEEMLKNMPWVDNSSYGHANAVVSIARSTEKELRAYPNQVGTLLTELDNENVSDNNNLKPSDIISVSGGKVTFTPYKVAGIAIPCKIVHAYKNANGEWEWVDIAKYEGDTTQVGYVYLTDTNTQKVFAEDDYKVLRLMHEDDGNGTKTIK